MMKKITRPSFNVKDNNEHAPRPLMIKYKREMSTILTIDVKNRCCVIKHSGITMDKRERERERKRERERERERVLTVYKGLFPVGAHVHQTAAHGLTRLQGIHPRFGGRVKLVTVLAILGPPRTARHSGYAML